ncbi:uncharacterized protein CRV24_007865 [Beauveria bassiana]|nr:uncharacterized protein CRV24_007865 [Beauveria bassiana]
MNCSDTTIQAPAWATQTTEEDDLDEPPELRLHHPQPQQFHRSAIRRPSEQPSLLTKAFKEQDHDDFREPPRSILTTGGQRRRSMASTVSIASTADLTSDTGMTSPSRTNTPSPPIPEMAMLRLNRHGFRISPNAIAHSQTTEGQVQETPKEAPRKRCIQFACAAKPQPNAANTVAAEKVTVAQEPRRPCIRFACPPRPAETQQTPPRPSDSTLAPTSRPVAESPSTPKKISALSAALAASPVTVQRLSNIPQASRPKFLRANSTDLVKDSSQFHDRKAARRSKPRNIHLDHDAHDLPDSTDFVCGTLDEDRPIEEAYLTCLAARRNEKLRIIPQDIDPSFPTSDPEHDDDDDDRRNGSEEDSWMPAKMDGIHDEDRSRRRRKSEQASPRKYHSPPPKRRLSPAPKIRARSPKPLFDRRSPRRLRSPAPRALTTPLQSPHQDEPAQFRLAGRPDVTHTKSLPRPTALFRMKAQRAPKRQDDEIHVRGAVDIVKGLEKKRQRRKDKFNQKYCNKARRGQIPERKTQPGQGAERMKELGLLMAGKKDPGNYVLSV